MRFNKILSLCKKTQRVHLLTDSENHMQYLSDTAAMYPLYGLPEMSIENIQNLMGLTDKQRESWIFTEANSVEGIYVDDTFSGEERIEPLPIIIDITGSKLFTYTSSIGLVMIQKQYLDALSCTGDVELFLRIHSEQKNRYTIIAKSGFMNYGAIMPVIPDDSMKTQFDTLNQQFNLLCENIDCKN